MMYLDWSLGNNLRQCIFFYEKLEKVAEKYKYETTIFGF